MSQGYCLAWECLGRSGSLAAYSDDGCLLASQELPGPAGAHLVPEIEATIQRLGLPHSLAVAIGPGSFTGLRISTVAARCLAWAESLPVIPVPSLAALACQQGPGRWYTLLALKKDVTFHAAYQVKDQSWQELSPVQACEDQQAWACPPAACVAVGPALAEKPALAQQLGLPLGSPQPLHAEGVAKAALSCPPLAWDQLFPAYHRPSAAELQRQHSAAPG